MDLHTVVEIGTGLVAFAGFVVMLMIRNTQAEVKEELTKQDNATALALAVHSAQDEEKFKAVDVSHRNLDAKLERIEGKIDRMNGTTVVVQQKP